MEEGKRKIEKKSDYCKNNPNFCMLPQTCLVLLSLTRGFDFI